MFDHQLCKAKVQHIPLQNCLILVDWIDLRLHNISCVQKYILRKLLPLLSKKSIYAFFSSRPATALNMLFSTPYPKFSSFSTFYKLLIFFIHLLVLYNQNNIFFWIILDQIWPKWIKMDQTWSNWNSQQYFLLFPHFTNS